MSAARSGLTAATVCILTVISTLPIGCGGGQTHGAAFDPEMPDDGEALSALQKTLSETIIPPNPNIAVGVFGDRELVGRSLDAKAEPWTFDHPIDCRPIVAGNVVVGAGDNELFGLTADTGKLLWTRKIGGCLRGAADDGATTVVSVRPVTGRGGIVIAIDRSGLVLRQIEDDSNIGAPAVVGKIALLPWEGRYVSAYDIEVGEELARIRFPRRVTQSFTHGGAIFFGDRKVTRFDARIQFVSAENASTLSLPERPFPGDPKWIRPADDILPPRPDPSDRVRLIAAPEARGPMKIENGRYVATHGHAAVGMDASGGAIDWVHANSADFLGGAAYEGGFALCDAEGTITFLAARTGAAQGSVSLGKPVDVCVVQTDRVAPESLPIERRSPASSNGIHEDNTPEPSPSSAPLRDQMATVIRLKYPNDAPIQRFFLGELSRSPDPLATSTLIDLATNGDVAEDILPEARASLAARRSGVDQMLAELARTNDFLEGTTATPLMAPLAEALSALGEPRAAPLLASHLLDPSLPSDDIESVARALATLARPEDLPALRAFFAMTRTEPSDPALISATAHVALALARLGRSDLVAMAKTDPYTSEAVREKL